MASGQGPVTPQELQQLPLWAIVTWATRTARRVLPLVEHTQRHEWIDAVSNAIEIGERYAADAAGNADAAYAAYAAANAAADAAAYAAAYAASAAADAAAAARAAARAAHAAAYAAAHATTESTAYKDDDAAYVADAAYAAASTDGDYATHASARIDFELLISRAFNEKWNSSTPVPQTVFGPLWPERVPIPSWAAAATEDAQNARSAECQRLRVEFSIPPNVDPKEANRLISEVLQRANELHHAFGGHGLTIAGAEAYETEPALLPAGGSE